MPKTQFMDESAIDIDRKSVAYGEGRLAYRMKERMSKCPYAIGHQQRSSWMTGWLDERCARKHATVWKKYGIEYP